MNKILLLFIFFGVTVSSLSGCARISKPSKYALEGYSSRPDWSAALNVVEAAGIDNLDDVKADKKYLHGGKIGDDGSVLESAVFSSAAFLSDLNQLGFATLPLSFFSWNYISRDRSLRVGRKIYGWMPAALANSPEEAIAVQSQLIQKAVNKAVQDFDPPAPYEIDREKSKFTIEKDEKYGTIRSYNYRYVKGGGGKSYAIGFYYSSMSIDGTAMPVLGTAPDFLGGKTAWAFTSYAFFWPLSNAYFEQNPQEKLNFLFPFLLEVSKNLPEWNYLYIFDYSLDGKHRFPIVLNQGKIMLFIRPE